MELVSRLAKKTGMAPWAVVLLGVFAGGLLLTGVIAAVMSATSGGTPPARGWTADELKAKFLLRSMDDIEPVLDASSSQINSCRRNVGVTESGALNHIRYYSFPLKTPAGVKLIDVTFMGKGNRCTMIHGID